MQNVVPLAAQTSGDLRQDDDARLRRLFLDTVAHEGVTRPALRLIFMRRDHTRAYRDLYEAAWCQLVTLARRRDDSVADPNYLEALGYAALAVTQLDSVALPDRVDVMGEIVDRWIAVVSGVRAGSFGGGHTTEAVLRVVSSDLRAFWSELSPQLQQRARPALAFALTYNESASGHIPTGRYMEAETLAVATGDFNDVRSVQQRRWRRAWACAGTSTWPWQLSSVSRRRGLDAPSSAVDSHPRRHGRGSR